MKCAAKNYEISLKNWLGHIVANGMPSYTNIQREDTRRQA